MSETVEVEPLRRGPVKVNRKVIEGLVSLVAAIPDADLPAAERAALYGVLKGVRARPTDRGLWPGGYTMIGRDRIEATWDAIRALDAKHRPQDVRHAFDLALLYCEMNTGEVLLTRDELAAKMHTSSAKVSGAMGVLERLGVITRHRHRVSGVRGRGLAVYFLNPHVAWNGDLELRKDAMAGVDPPLLRMMEGPRA